MRERSSQCRSSPVWTQEHSQDSPWSTQVSVAGVACLSLPGMGTAYGYLYVDKGPRGVVTHLDTRGALNFIAIYHTLAALACGPHPLGRPWGRIGAPELPKGSFGMPKSPQSGLNIGHFMLSREDFKGRVAFNGTRSSRIMEIMRE